MKILVLSISALLLTIVSRPAIGMDRSGGEAASAVTSDLLARHDKAEVERNYKRNRFMQVMGFALLGSSVAMSVAGAGMVEGSPYGPVSRIGLISIGSGLLHFIAAAFLLGFSKSVINQELPALPPPRLKQKTAYVLTANGDILF